MPDPFIYREVKALLTARIPDTADADENPDRVPLNGYGTAHPKFKGGSVVFTEQGEFAIPRDIPVRVVDGHLMVEVLDGEDVVLQPLYLPVTVDERANQSWSYQLTFGTLTIGERGDEVTHPPLSFPVEDGEGPLELSTVATAVVQTGAFITRGAPGAGLTEITAANGRLEFEYSDGRVTTVDVPDTVPGPPGPMVDVQAGAVEVGETPEDYAITVTGEGDSRALNIRFPKPEKGDKGDGVTDAEMAVRVKNPASETYEALGEVFTAQSESFLAEQFKSEVVARNIIQNPLMPDAGTVKGWFALSGSQPAPTWAGSRLRWQPTSTGTNCVSNVAYAEEGDTVTVTLTVQAQVGSRPRIHLFHGTSANEGTIISTVQGETSGAEQTFTLTGALPADEHRFRVGVNLLSAAGWVEVGEVTTADSPFDGYTEPTAPLDTYRWLGVPFESASVHLRGGLTDSVLSDEVRTIEVVDEPPVNNPDKVGTLYIAPAFRPPVFTDFDRGLNEITPRWDRSVIWEAGGSSITKPPVATQHLRAGCSLNAAGKSKNAEALILASATGASEELATNRFGPILRGGGDSEADATGVTAMLRYTHSGGQISIGVQEYRPSAVTIQESLVAAGAHSGTQFWVRFRVVEDMAFAKAWELGDTEPIDWQVAAQVTIVDSGWVGVRSSIQAPATFERMGVSFNHEKAPGAY